MNCGDPGTPSGGGKTGDDFTFNQTVHYHCHPGFILSGPTDLQCQINGSWNGDPPTCNASKISQDAISFVLKYK